MVFHIMEIAVTVFVSAVVWVTLLVGLVQFAREEMDNVRLSPHRAQKLVREGYSK